MDNSARVSRAVAGIARGKIFFAMPGCNKAVELAMRKLIVPELPHVMHEVRGLAPNVATSISLHLIAGV